MMKKTVFIAFKTHFDIGFTDLSERVVAEYASVQIPAVSETSRRLYDASGERFVWTMPAWPIYNILRNGGPAAEEADRLIRNGNLVWHALPFTFHSEICGEEDFTRSLYYSAELTKRYGFAPRTAKMTDVPEHTRQIVSLLYHGGVRFFHLGCNAGSMPAEVPFLFWWKAADDSRLLTMYNPGAYGTPSKPPEDWPYSSWMHLCMTNDNVGCPSAEHVEEVLAAARRENPDAEVRIGSMDDFYDRISQEDLSTLPVLNQELSDSWIHGVGTYPAEVGRMRRLRRSLCEAEKAANLLSVYSGRGENRYGDMIRQTYENIHLFNEHTWGIDVKVYIGSPRYYEKLKFLEKKETPAYQYLEKSWNEQRARAQSAGEGYSRIAQGLEEEMAEIAGRDQLAVYVPHKLNGPVPLYVQGLQENEGLADADGSPLYELSTAEGRAFVLPDTQSGFHLYTITGQKPVMQTSSLEVREEGDILYAGNRFVQVGIHRKTGRMVSLYDCINRKEWAHGSRPYGFSYDIIGFDTIERFKKDYIYTESEWIDHDLGRDDYPNVEDCSFTPDSARVSHRAFEHEIVITCEFSMPEEAVSLYGCPAAVTLEIDVRECSEAVRFKLKIAGKPASPYAEAGHMSFPLSLDNPRYRINKLGAPLNPAADIVNAANHSLYCLDEYVDVSDGEHGMCVLSPDTPLLQLGSKKIYQYHKTYTPEEPVLHFNLFNNWWGTNFPQWIEGDMESTWFLYPYAGELSEDKIRTYCDRFLSEPIVVRGEAEGCCSVDLSGLQMTAPPECRIQAIQKYGKGYLVRIKSYASERRELRWIALTGFSHAWLADSQGHKLQPLCDDADNQAFIMPCETVSVLLCPDSE